MTRKHGYKQDYKELFSQLTSNIELLIQEVKAKKSTLKATDEWSVKDEFCHIVFWHENYAANYEALANDEIPKLPENMSTINMRGVKSLRKYSIRDLVSRLHSAHESLFVSIVEKRVPRMTYSKGGRTYETGLFLTMITRHIFSHIKQVQKAK